MNSTYYPQTNDGRADWWQNILDNASALPQLSFTVTEAASITADAAGGVYCYRTVRQVYEDFHSSAIAYADGITDGTVGSPLPLPPVPPAFPAPPAGLAVGIEARREKWVATAKSSATYTPVLGTLLKLESPSSTFDPATYQAELFSLTSPSARTLSGKFRKASGQIDGINLYGRKEGTTAWVLIGRFTALPFSASIPLAGSVPEPWEFQARAVKKDAEIGQPSDIVAQIVRG